MSVPIVTAPPPDGNAVFRFETDYINGRGSYEMVRLLTEAIQYAALMPGATAVVVTVEVRR